MHVYKCVYIYTYTDIYRCECIILVFSYMHMCTYIWLLLRFRVSLEGARDFLGRTPLHVAALANAAAAAWLVKAGGSKKVPFGLVRGT